MSSFGIELHARELDAALASPEGATGLLGAVSKHLVVVIRQRSLDAEDVATLGRNLGTPSRIPFSMDPPIVDEVIGVERSPRNRGAFLGGDWHSDLSFMPMIPELSLLHGEVVSSGGDTLFVDRRASIRHLSSGLLGTLRGLSCVHTAASSLVTYRGAQSDIGMRIFSEADFDSSRTTPLIGIRANGEEFVSLCPASFTRFLDWEQWESEDLARYLARFTMREEFQFRVAWQPGTTVLSANQLVAHRVACDFAGTHRRLLRSNVLAPEEWAADLGGLNCLTP